MLISEDLDFPFPIESLEQLMAYQPQIQEMNRANYIISVENKNDNVEECEILM